MNFLTLLLSGILLSGTIQVGVAPGHQMALYTHLDDMPILDPSYTNVAKVNIEAVFWGHAFLEGGFTSYSLKEVKEVFAFYPFRQDYTLGGGLQWRDFRLGYFHGCYHSIAPNMTILPFPKIDGLNSRIYAEGKKEMEINRHVSISGDLKLGVVLAHSTALYDKNRNNIYYDVPNTAFANLQAKATFWKHVFVEGGVASYSLEGISIHHREYYAFGAGVQFGNFKLGYSHGVDNQLAPNGNIPYFDKVDKEYNKFYLEATIGTKGF